jgi:hypothetical protein
MHLDVVQGIIGGTRPVDQDAAIRLANGTGVPSSFWLDAQAGYDADIARGAGTGEIPREVLAAVDAALDRLPQPERHTERDRWRIASRVALAAAIPVLAELTGRRIEEHADNHANANGEAASEPSDRHAPHAYVSTACFHEECGSCRSTCKYCDAPCSHGCHPADLSLPKPWVHQARDIAVLLLAELGPDRVPAVLRERIATDPDLFWLRRPDPGRA